MPHARPPLFCLRPHLPPPGRDRRFVAFDRSMLGYLPAGPDAVQQQRHTAQGVPLPKQPGDELRYPRQGPTLVFDPAVRGGALLKRGREGIELGLGQPATTTRRAFRDQPGRTVSQPTPSPDAYRVVRYPKPPGDLRIGTSCANNAAACNRTASRRAWPSAVSPPPSG